MTEFFTYSIKTLLSMGLFVSIYRLGFMREYNFRMRRMYLLISISLALILPLVSSFIPASSGSINPASSVILNEITIYSNGLHSIEQRSNIPFMTIFFFVYLTVFILLLSRIIYQLLIIFFKSKRIPEQYPGPVKVFRISGQKISFSFFHLIFIGNTRDDNDFRQILAHEKTHAIQLHTIDVIAMEILSSVFWFNPLIWWFRREIKNVHEYLADEGALNHGFNQKSYQITLLEHLIGSASISITNNFNYSLIKNRILMMNKKEALSKNLWKIFLLIPLSLLLLIGFSCTKKTDSSPGLTGEKKSDIYYEQAYEEVDVMPEYPGGLIEIRKFIATHLKYPDEARLNNISGRVYVQFVVDKEGSIVTDTKKYRIEGDENIIGEVVVVGYEEDTANSSQTDTDYSSLLKKEAVRVVELLPPFKTPALKDGKPVAIVFTIPINFALE